MALKTQTFNNFDINNDPQIADFLVGVCSDGSSEFRTPLNKVGAYTTEGVCHSIHPISGDNTSSGCYSVVSGGLQNIAGTQYSAVVGGKYNQACSTAAGPNASAFVGGGHDNCACGDWNPAVVGGAYNCATGSNSFVGGGCNNLADGYHSIVAGGSNNNASGTGSTVLGGRGNSSSLPRYIVINSNYSSINGDYYASFDGPGGLFYYRDNGPGYIYYDGNNNWVLYSYEFENDVLVNRKGLSQNGWERTWWSNEYLSGLNYVDIANNYNYGDSTTISGGRNNVAVGDGDVISGGCRNTTYSGYYWWDEPSVIGGGCCNLNAGSFSTISGGQGNTTWSAYGGTISGGRYNVIGDGWAPTIGGGQDNCVSGGSSTVAGGKYNCAGGYLNSDGPDSEYYRCVHASTISGGGRNWIGGDCSTISGGYHNKISGECYYNGEQTICRGFASTVSGGYNNHIRYSNNSVIGGGINNTIHNNRECSSILGGSGNDVYHNNSHIIGSNISTCQSDTTFVNNLVTEGNVIASSGFPSAGAGNVGYGFSSGDGDTGMFSYNPDGSGDNDGHLTFVANHETVLRVDSGGLTFLRLAGVDYNVSRDSETGALILTPVE